jgi:hypothetical protein
MKLQIQSTFAFALCITLANSIPLPNEINENIAQLEDLAELANTHKKTFEAQQKEIEAMEVKVARYGLEDSDEKDQLINRIKIVQNNVVRGIAAEQQSLVGVKAVLDKTLQEEGELCEGDVQCAKEVQTEYNQEIMHLQEAHAALAQALGNFQ